MQIICQVWLRYDSKFICGFLIYSKHEFACIQTIVNRMESYGFSSI